MADNERLGMAARIGTRPTALLIAAIGWWCTALGASDAAGERPSALPNVVVFLIDDMGLMDSSTPFLTDDEGAPQAYPLNRWYRTPAMDRLAEGGMRLSHFYSHSVCSPTRISLMTGQNAARHRTTTWIRPEKNNGGPFGPPDWNWQGLDRSSVTLPRLLREQGYRTIFVGKGHFGPLESDGADPRNLGFDVNIGGDCWGRPKSYYGRDHYGNHPKYENRYHAVPGLEAYHGTDVYLTEALTREALKEVDKAVSEKQPFFLYFAHYAVHSPFQADPRFADHYQQKSPRAQAFATMIEGIDRSLGDLTAWLEEQGVAEETVIFFLGDNGSDAPLGGKHDIASSAPLRGKKGTHLEGGVRVPFIASWAKPAEDHPLQRRLPIEANAIRSDVAACYDLFPTIAGLAGAATPEGHQVDGQRLDALLAGEADPSRQQVFLSHFPHPHNSDYFTTYRQGRWKVVYYYFPEATRYELYDLESDPAETTNLAEEEPEQLRKMMSAMIADLNAKDACFPVKEGKRVVPTLPEDRS